MPSTTGPVNEDTLITIKISFDDCTKRLKLPLKDLSANTLPIKVLSAYRHIKPSILTNSLTAPQSSLHRPRPGRRLRTLFRLGRRLCRPRRLQPCCLQDSYPCCQGQAEAQAEGICSLGTGTGRCSCFGDIYRCLILYRSFQECSHS
jgi:hypothetical protein